MAKSLKERSAGTLPRTKHPAAPKVPARPLSFLSPESSNIAEAFFDPEMSQIIIRFHHGRSYAYYSVPDAVWDGFVAAESKGSYFSLHIKDAYSCQKL